MRWEPRVAAIMLRQLTEEQIRDWFTIGKAVTDVEFLGEEAQAGTMHGPPCSPPSPFAAREPLMAVGANRDQLLQRDCRMLYHMEKSSWYLPDSIKMPSGRNKVVFVLKYGLFCTVDPIGFKGNKTWIVSLIENNSVVIVQGATGSGKSTQIPQYILDYCIQRSIYCNIAVTQPRKIGASSIARWISKERSWTLGELVGYQVSLENISTKETRLLYMTTGVLLEKVVCAKSLTKFTHIFIDEVHERTEEMDFLLLVIRKLLRTNSQSVKIILMSASINCEEFADYFALPVHDSLNPACVFKVDGKPYEIEEYYLDDLKYCVHFQLRSQKTEEPWIAREMYDVAVSLIQSFDELEMKNNRGGKNLNVTSERGTVLVFLPGMNEITNMHSRLSNMFNKRWQVYPLHSHVTLEEQSNVFLATVPGYRKIILSTNIAESSVTVPDVKYGRAGRVSKGYCYRLVYKEFWTDFIPEKSVPEILRCPLGTTVLKIKKLDMGAPKALLATALSPPSIRDIERTILQLKELGAITTCVQTEENPHDGELTFMGKVLAQLPVDLRLGKLIVLGHVFRCLEECLIIAAALSLRNFFVARFKQHVDGYRNKLFFAGNSKSDCIAIVNAFKAWQDCRRRGELRHPKEELEWGRSNGIHIKKLREVVIAGAFYPNYFTFGKCDEVVAVRDLDGKDPKTTVLLKNIPPYGYLYHKQLQSLFRQCGQVKSITYDGSKAFVEFSRNPVEGFKILPAVYLSVKMSQLKIPFELNVRYPGDIERQLPDVRAVKSLRIYVDCQKQTVEPVEISFGALQKSDMIPNRHLCIKITEIVEVGHFWGYRIDEKNRTVLQALTAEINYQNLMDLSVSPHPDLVCLAPFTQLGNRGYCRARILCVCGDFAEVFFVDYGNRSKVPLNRLKEIPSCLRELPFQALEFKIRKMRPSAKSFVCGEGWSYSASQRFASLVNGYSLLVEVYSMVHSVLYVDVFRYSRCGELVNIRDVLIEECFAEPAEESYESKVTVCGPFSPYEVKCYTMTRASQFRKVFIMKESINSVVVHDAPEDPFQQLLVAAFLSANASGSTVILDETSLMPPIPGLVALLSMLFAPAIELRVDKCRKDFTGVLCGLGWSQTCGAPLFPENDMELTFDAHIGVKDITEINILRIAINKLLRECAAHSGQDKMTQLQESIRQKLLCLICKSKPREIIAPTWYEQPYEWNQVDSQHIIDQSEKQHERGDDLYQIHKLVLLNV
ncbi:Tdrd9 [Columba guinea]|nr:Tdrd9 [Columba guinea]